ncbi:MAG: hypothetical protein NW226_15130 [Microscillaceae bacterium]|nr:hypothetical protein [Microscillaceae bacterium]
MNKRIVSLILMAIGAINVLSGFSSFNFFQLLIGGGIGFTGWHLYQRSQKELKHQKQSMLNRPVNFELNDEMIIRLARRLGGKLTPEELSSQTSLSLAQAKDRLESLHSKGVCTIDLDDIDEDGKIYYRF